MIHTSERSPPGHTAAAAAASAVQGVGAVGGRGQAVVEGTFQAGEGSPGI